MIGATLKTQRQARGLSLGALALKAGVNKSTLSRWEAGKSIPYARELGQVMAALELSEAQRRTCWQSLDAPRWLEVVQTQAPRHASPLSSGELLRALRLRAQRTQTEAARAVGVTRERVSQWENGESWPEGQRLHGLCYFLGATVEETLHLTTRAWQQHGELPTTREGLDQAVLYLEFHEPSPHRDLPYLALASRYHTLYRKGELEREEATAVWGHYAYFLTWRHQRFADAERIAAPVIDALGRSGNPLNFGQREALSALMEGWQATGRGTLALDLLTRVEGRVPRLFRSWWHAFLAGSVGSLGLLDPAISHYHESVRLASHALEENTRRQFFAAFLCQHARYAEALSVLQVPPATETRAATHATYHIHYSWALAGLGEKVAARRELSRTLPLIHQHAFEDLVPLATRLDRWLSA